jgi:hypothetical protein
MGRARHCRLSHGLFGFLALAACLLCATGCHNFCVSGVLNSPASTINLKVGDPPPSCSLSTANGVVRVEIAAASGGTSAPGAAGPHIAHLFVTLTGVDANPSALADDRSPGRQPLVAGLQAHPLQIDLLDDPHASGSSAPFPDTPLPAGIYREVRLHLAVASSAEPLLETNRCGANTPHCAVMSDGRVWPLAFLPSTLEVRILSESIEGRSLYVPPDGAATLVINLDRDRSFLWPSGDSLLFTPAFHLSVQQSREVPED